MKRNWTLLAYKPGACIFSDENGYCVKTDRDYENGEWFPSASASIETSEIIGCEPVPLSQYAIEQINKQLDCFEKQADYVETLIAETRAEMAESAAAYNKELNQRKAGGPHEVNRFVMDHTMRMCAEDPYLAAMVRYSSYQQKVVYDNEPFFFQANESPTTNIVFSHKRSFEAASAYKGKRIAVLNFANNHSVGGNPWGANAQEEGLCRCSTLYPCIAACKEVFYERHKRQFRSGEMDNRGNDDLIYTKNVVVFKSDESAPRMLPREDWFKVDVITCAAPYFDSEDQALRGEGGTEAYLRVVQKRIRKILQAAYEHSVEVLILGAFGCGAFNNPKQLMALAFKNELGRLKIPTVEFAIYSQRPLPNDNYHIFKRVITGEFEN